MRVASWHRHAQRKHTLCRFSKFIYKRFDRVLQRYFSDFYHMKQRRDKHTNPTVQTVFKQASINMLCSCVSPIISYDKIRTLNMIITMEEECILFTFKKIFNYLIWLRLRFLGLLLKFNLDVKICSLKHKFKRSTISIAIDGFTSHFSKKTASNLFFCSSKLQTNRIKLSISITKNSWNLFLASSKIH